jgi:hypothetical protein
MKIFTFIAKWFIYPLFFLVGLLQFEYLSFREYNEFTNESKFPIYLGVVVISLIFIYFIYHLLLLNVEVFLFSLNEIKILASMSK